MERQSNQTLGVFRHELKYYISERDAYRLAQYFRHLMHIDKHADSYGKYWIRSLYFDTQCNKDFYDKVNGYTKRRKLRLRIYDTASDTAKLELKSKHDAYVHKESILLDKEYANKIIHGNYAFLTELPCNADKFYACFCLEPLRPILLIDYERLAFELPFENIRITIDRNLRASMDGTRLFDKSVPLTNVMNKEHCILEVKYRHVIPNFIRSILSEIDIPSTSISKYVICRQTIYF